MTDADQGSVALLALLGGGLALGITLVSVLAVADLLVTRSRAQTAADAAALAAMADPTGDGREGAGSLAEANDGDVVACCGDDPTRRQVRVAVAPASVLLRAVAPRIEASAAAALVAGHPLWSGIAPPAIAGAGGRVWPLQAAMTSGFGTRTHPLTGAARLHAGIDLGAPTGTPIRAAASGTVVAAGTMGGYGYTIDVRHTDGTTTRYAHQSQLLVRAGQQVAAGQVIGLVGSTGASTGPHLHFEVRTPSGPVDPLTWLP